MIIYITISLSKNDIFNTHGHLIYKKCMKNISNFNFYLHFILHILWKIIFPKIQSINIEIKDRSHMTQAYFDPNYSPASPMSNIIRIWYFWLILVNVICNMQPGMTKLVIYNIVVQTAWLLLPRSLYQYVSTTDSVP